MPSHAPVSDYLDQLTRALRYDPRLADRVRREVEAHLWDAAADASPEAQRRAVADFGAASTIAEQFAALSVARQSRRAGTVLILAAGCVFLAMRVRLAWYGATIPALGADFPHIRHIVAFDRGAFLVALALSLVSWFYLAVRPAWGRREKAPGSVSRRAQLLMIFAAGPLLLSILADVVLAGLRVTTATTAATISVPLLSMVVEIACAALLVVEIAKVSRRTEAWLGLPGE
jgi:hypothetical protein